MIKRFSIKLPTVLVLMFLSIVFFSDIAYSKFYKWVDSGGQVQITDSPPPEIEPEKEPEKEPAKADTATKVLPAKVLPSPVPSPALVQTPMPAPTAIPQPPATAAHVTPVPNVPPAAPTRITTPQVTNASPPAAAIASAPPISMPPPATPRVQFPVTKTKPAESASNVQGLEMLNIDAAGLMKTIKKSLPYVFAVLALMLAGTVVFLYTLYKIAKKLQVSTAWMAWVPVLNSLTMAEAAGRPAWWGVLLLVPLVGTVFFVIFWMDICQRLGLKKTNGLLMLIPLLAPTAVASLAPRVIMMTGANKIVIIAFVALFVLTLASIFFLPLFYLLQSERRSKQTGYDGYDSDEPSTVPLDNLPEEESPVFLKKTSSDSTQTAQIDESLYQEHKSDTDSEMAGSDLSFSREYILEQAEKQEEDGVYVIPSPEDSPKGFELKEKITAESNGYDAGDAYGYSEDSTLIIGDKAELGEKPGVDFEQAGDTGDIGLEVEFKLEDKELIINKEELTLDGVEEGTPEGVIDFEIAEQEDESTSEASTWVLGKGSSAKKQEEGVEVEGGKEEPPTGEIDFEIAELADESTSEDSTWVQGKDISGTEQQDGLEAEDGKEESPTGEIDFEIAELEDKGEWEESTMVLKPGIAGTSEHEMDGRVEPESIDLTTMHGELEIDLEGLGDKAASKEPTLDYGSELGEKDEAGLDIEPAIDLEKNELELEDSDLTLESGAFDIEGVDQKEPLGELEIELEGQGSTNAFEQPALEESTNDIEDDTTEEGIELDLDLDLEEDKVLSGEFEIELEEELEESEAPTFVSDYKFEDTGVSQPVSHKDGHDDLNDIYEEPTLIAVNGSKIKDESTSALDRIELEPDMGLDYDEGLKIDIEKDDIDFDLDYGDALNLNTNDKTLIIGREHESREKADAAAQPSKSAEAASLNGDREEDVYDISGEEGLELADDDDITFSQVDSLPGSLQGSEPSLSDEESGLDLDIDDEFDKTLELDLDADDKEDNKDNAPLNTNELTVDNETIRLYNKKDKK
ncbi:MAG: hypothetical protein HQL06_09290 [Nitrospirae bacterium]|nr:hypothetical protein [Nitrospirota bacterium]